MSAGRHGHRAPLLWLLLPFAAGLAGGRLMAGPPSCLLAAASFVGLLATASSWSDHSGFRRLWPFFFVSASFLAGFAYYHLRWSRPAGWEGLPPREARLTLLLEHIFPSPDDSRHLSGFAVVIDAERHLHDLVGQRISFSLNLPGGGNPPLRTSTVIVIGVLELLPRQPAGDGFAQYLANAGINFMFSRGQLLQTVAPPSSYQRFCHVMAVRLHDVLGAGLHDRPALAAVLRAMMLGQTQELAAGQKDLFMRSGTLHLFAISGQHIGVIALCLQGLLLLLRMPRLAATLISLVALRLYVDITGASPSAMRAFIMCALVIASFTLRRPGNVLSALAASALLILLLDPLQLFSPSFQMSYGVVAALVLLGVPMAEALQTRWALFVSLPEISRRWHQRMRANIWRWFLGLLGLGLAASLVSALAGVQFFHLFTPVALPANLLLIPLASLVLGAGFGSMLCGLAGCTPGSVLFNHAAALVLWVMDRLVHAAVAAPGLYLPAQYRPDWLGPVAQAALFAVCLAGYAGRWRSERGGFWPPFALVGLTLALAVRFGA